MSGVQGIGGVFFRAKDPKAMGEWYERVLGIPAQPGGWRSGEGVTVFTQFEHDSDYFGAPDQQWMVNFRVADMDAMIAHLRSEGIEITENPDWNSDIGRFIRIHDPEGNPIELWEPSEMAR